jgi:hypothetical protein
MKTAPRKGYPMRAMREEIKGLIARYNAEHRRYSANFDPLRIEGQKNIARAEIIWQVMKDLQMLLDITEGQ